VGAFDAAIADLKALGASLDAADTIVASVLAQTTGQGYGHAISAYQQAGAVAVAKLAPEIDGAGAAAATQPFTQQAWQINGVLSGLPTSAANNQAGYGTALSAGTFGRQMQALYTQAIAAGTAALGAPAPPPSPPSPPSPPPPPAPPPGPSGGPSTLDAAFWPALWAMASKYNVRPEVLLTIWWAESGLNPKAQNHQGCTGLNQSCPKSMGGPGFPVDVSVYKNWPASQQLTWIEPQLAAALALAGAPFQSAARYQQANWLPGTLKTATQPGDVIAASTGTYAAAYAGNCQFDQKPGSVACALDHKTHAGTVTLQDLGDYLQSKYTGGFGSILRSAVTQAYASAPAGAPWSAPLADWFHEPGSAPPPQPQPPGPPPPVPPGPYVASSSSALPAVAGLSLLGVIGTIAYYASKVA